MATLRKYIILLTSVILTLACASCDEEKESPLLFEISSNTNPDSIMVGYYTEEIGVTLHPKQKSYFITTSTDCDGDVALTCTNCNNLSYTTDCTFSIVEENVGKHIPATEEQIGVSLKILNSKTLNIHFDNLQDKLPTGVLGTNEIIKVYGKIDGKDVVAKITIYRSKPI